MSNAIALSQLRKLRYTPLSDLLRGRVSGRLDVRAFINASDLPAPLRATVLRVVRRSHLWRSEKIEVAHELLAHFADGLDAGETAERLIESFGDERAAAKLIRQAKKRGRPLAWHALRVFSWGVVAVVLLYLAAGLRFVISRPSPSVNYVEQHNRPLHAVAEGDRGWPVYRTAILSLRGEQGAYHPDLQSPIPRDRWPALREWVLAHADALAQARVAASKPVLGFVLGGRGSIQDSELYPKLHPDTDDSAAGPLLCSVLLPHLSDLRMVALTLGADARLAREQGDLPRALADVTAIVRMAEQLHASGGFIIGDLVALGVRDIALNESEALLLDGHLDTNALERLSHLLARPARTTELFSIEGDHDVLRDAIQRMYTDDGAGDGHMTWKGMMLAADGFSLREQPQWKSIAMEAPLTTGSRREMLTELDGYFATCASLLAQPRREADWSRADAWRWKWTSDFPRYWPIMLVAPSVANVHRMSETYLGRRDGLLIGLALEAQRLRSGKYPDSLDALAPDYFAELPVDRITGEPLHYRLVAGKPRVYSVGADRDDDGGKVTQRRSGGTDPSLAAQWNVKPQDAADGDWILFPTPAPDEADGEH